jgi:hypothetical protein
MYKKLFRIQGFFATISSFSSKNLPEAVGYSLGRVDLPKRNSRDPEYFK